MTLKRARKKLEYLSKKDGYSGGWKWYTPEQWANYEEVLQGKKQTEDDHLRENVKNGEKNINPPAQKYDLLRSKKGVKKGLKPTGSKCFTEGDHVPEKNTEEITDEITEKLPENPKVINSPLLGEIKQNHTDFDDWGVV